jgi:iron only hydrogenase large subunit-like protein
MKGIKRATIKIGDKEVKVAVVATARNARSILEEIKKAKQIMTTLNSWLVPWCIGGVVSFD